MHTGEGHVDCRGRVEVEAESVADVVCGAAGLDTSEYSLAYVARWADRTDDAERTLLATGERIVSEAATSLGRGLQVRVLVDRDPIQLFDSRPERGVRRGLALN